MKDRQRKYAAQNSGAQANRVAHQTKRMMAQEAGRTKARQGRMLHLMGSMLYWAEGAKSKNTLQFVNSDPNMLVLFLRFLREELEVDNSEIMLRIQCHLTDIDSITALEDFWLQRLCLPRMCLEKTHQKRGGTSSHNKLPYGVSGIRVHRTELVQHINGAIQEYGGFDQPAWLF